MERLKKIWNRLVKCKHQWKRGMYYAIWGGTLRIAIFRCEKCGREKKDRWLWL